MTDNNNPIKPPPELIEDWIELSRPSAVGYADPNKLATLAARWGADQELEECCEWIEVWCTDPHQPTARLRAARRPKPPSLKDQALAIVENLGICDHLSPENERIIRSALESLPD